MPDLYAPAPTYIQLQFLAAAPAVIDGLRIMAVAFILNVAYGTGRHLILLPVKPKIGNLPVAQRLH
jgi:hypothetical protein